MYASMRMSAVEVTRTTITVDPETRDELMKEKYNGNFSSVNNLILKMLEEYKKSKR